MRGVNFLSLYTPETSARIMLAPPPIPRVGRIATANTMIPIPPNQLSK